MLILQSMFLDYCQKNFFYISKKCSNREKQSCELQSVLTLVAVIVPLQQGAPGRVTLTGKMPHVQVADCQADDWGLV